MPPSISGGSGVNVELAVRSADGRAHTVTVRGLSLKVPAGRSATGALHRPPNGTYPVEVDGAPRGSLIIGAQPGP